MRLPKQAPPVIPYLADQPVMSSCAGEAAPAALFEVSI